MSRIKAITLGASLLGAMLILFAMEWKMRTAHDLTGRWTSWRSDLRISKREDTYEISIDNPSGLLGGVYAGKLRGDVLFVTGPLAALCGEMQYSRNPEKLEFCGEEFTRAREEAGQ